MAMNCFNEMKADGYSPSRSTYKFLIIALCGRKGRKIDDALKIYNEMINSGHVPDKELIETYLGCLCETGRISEARKCIDSLQKSGYTVPLSYSLFIRAICRAGKVEEALKLVEEVGAEKSCVEKLTSGSIIHGLLQKGKLEEALTKEMLELGYEPNVVTYSALIHGYMNMGRFNEAWNLFYRMKFKGPFPDFKTYSMFLSCLCKVGRSEEAMELISYMLESGIVPSTINFRTVLYGLNREGKQGLARAVLQQKSEMIRKRKLIS
ncbi:hypothetical protein KIW84_024147 [Lathyrus oleraceus]|uniref:Pentatricopeptide repeat-containing protein-mitochondrial domain-containing protein n=1 Tax=Pisum sativum TaxID=3888 RepID=A0A9D4YEX9_PEA|nr:hypothetical protein KIW84_024147 [Pisum sativum]